MALIKMKVEDSKINDIGDAIREKLGTTKLYTIDEMPDAIRSIDGGGGGGGGGTPTWDSGPLVPIGKGFTYTVKINLNKVDEGADPDTWGIWTDDAASKLEECPFGSGENAVDALMGYYPCILTNTGEELAKLNPNNYKKTIDGNAYTSDYVMIYYPERGFRIWYEDENHLCVSITNEDNKANYLYPLRRGQRIDGYYIGTYPAITGLNSDNKTIFLSRQDTEQYAYNTSWDNSMSIISYNMPENWKMLSFFAWTYLTACALVKYKGKHIKDALGVGPKAKMHPGIMDNLGLNFASTANGLKIFGLEGLLSCYFSVYLDGYSSQMGIISNGYHNWGDPGSILDNYYFSAGQSISNTYGYLKRPTLYNGVLQPDAVFFLPSEVNTDSINNSLGGWVQNANGRPIFFSGSDTEFISIIGMNSGWACEGMYGSRIMSYKLKSE